MQAWRVARLPYEPHAPRDNHVHTLGSFALAIRDIPWLQPDPVQPEGHKLADVVRKGPAAGEKEVKVRGGGAF
jgi:hypothetical protein